MPLTDTACKNARGRATAYKMTDGAGMHLLVQPNGARLWRLSYRFEGRQKTISLGAYPDVMLAEARERRAAARKELADGKDPSPRAKAVAEQAPDNRPTFQAVADEWLDGMKVRWALPHFERVRRRLERDVFPDLGESPIEDIGAQDVLAAIRKVEGRGAIDMAKRSLQNVSQIFGYAIACGKAQRNPAADLVGALKPAPRVQHQASLKVADVPEFLIKLRAYDGEKQTRLAVEVVMHTFVRTSEMRMAQWSEIEKDIWRVPAERMKMGREHIVPLTPHVQGLLAQLKVIAGDSHWVLPGVRGKPISENTMLYALYRMGYHHRATIHGFRSLASTVLNESTLFQEDWIERQLAHVPSNKVRSAYNNARWMPQRRAMMEWYSAWLLRQDDLADLLG